MCALNPIPSAYKMGILLMFPLQLGAGSGMRVGFKCEVRFWGALSHILPQTRSRRLRMG